MIIKEHTRNQKRMYRIHKMEEQIGKDKYIIGNQQQEINRLNNIIDEFNKWLIGEKMMFYKSDDGERLIRFGETKNKWLELKGDNK